jgi:diguanylate cyclase (GGDEF)-like protein
MDLNQNSIEINKDSSGNYFRFVLNKFLLLFLPTAIITIASALYIYQSEVNADLLRTRYAEAASVQVGIEGLEQILQSSVEDLAYLSSQNEFIQFISEHKNLNTKVAESHWLTFSKTHQRYHQIRWLDVEGIERIRINYNLGNPTAVSKEQLQNKSHRYYFKKAIKSNQGEFYVSPFDLNIEREKIEQPVNPVIRIATPVFDRQGNRQGIVIINYFGNSLLTKFIHYMGNDHVNTWLINKEGYWLKGPSPELEWGFMYQRPEANVAHHYPLLWQHINAKEKGQFEDDYGLWTFSTIYPEFDAQKNGTNTIVTNGRGQQSKAYFWKAITLSPKENYLLSTKNTSINILIILSILLVFLLIGCWLLSQAWVKQKIAEDDVRDINEGLENTVAQRTNELKQAISQAELLANTDALTGMNNRRSFFSLGNTIHEQSQRYHHAYTIIMLDLDHFKTVNDSYGHQMGDIALKATSTAIEHEMRSSDVAGRIGGEEFAIILPETSIQNGLDLAERIRCAIANICIPLEDKRKMLKFTTSLGLSELKKEDNSLDDVLYRADEALYQAKNKGRNKIFKL